MNKKTIIFLINGFGIESKESYSIYDSSLMPTLDMLNKKYLFSPIESTVNNYYDGYRNMSLDTNELYNYSVLSNEIEDKKIENNEIFKKLKNDFNTKTGNLHLFILIDTSPKILDHLKEFIKYLNPTKTKQIFLHFIMTSNNITDYKKLANLFSKLNIEFNNIAPISFITGLSAVDNTAKATDLNFFFKMFITKVGEKWQSFTQKFDVLYGTKVIPRDTKPFMVNSNFNITKDDTFFIFNYDNIDLTNFLNTLSNITFGTEKNNFSYYSLFNVTSNLNITSILNSKLPSNCMTYNLELINSKALIACPKEQVNIINYFCNGLKNEASSYLTFVDSSSLTDLNTLVNFINSREEKIIILNYSIDEAKDVKELKEKLSEIDKYLKAIYDNMQGSKYSIIVSSLYGICKVMLNEKNNVCQVNFSGKVPFIFVDDFITKKNYLIANGNINGILKTAYVNINPRSSYDSLVEKQNSLYKIFFKS